MKRNNFFSAVVMMVMVMASVNANAQVRINGDRMAGNRGGREMVVRNDGRMHMNGGVMHRPAPRHGMIDFGGHRVDRRWEGRVRFEHGRWGYYRDNCWYWYDRYFEPDYYFARPVHHFHAHISPVARGVAGGVAAGVVVGAFISALCH